MEGLRREDEACIRTALAFVALANHSRLLGTTNNSNALDTDDPQARLTQAGNDDHGAASQPSSSQQAAAPAISLPNVLPRSPTLPLNPKRAHLIHILHLAKQSKQDSRILCLHLVQQLSQKDTIERLDFYRNELNGIVGITDDTVAPIRFPLLEHLLSFGGNSFADELLPLVRDFIVEVDEEQELAKWVFVAELTMSFASSTRPTLWEPVGTAWCDLRSMARTFQRTDTMELWRQHAFARLSQLAVLYEEALLE